MNVDYPIHFDERGGTAATRDADHLRDMIEQVLLTGLGERVNRPEFGSGLLQMVFEPGGPEVAAALEFAVKAQLERWLGDIVEVRACRVAGGESALAVEITWASRVTGEERSDAFTQGGRT